MGIRATLGRLSALLRCHDEELWEHLEKGVKVNPQFYAFRWVGACGGCLGQVPGWLADLGWAPGVGTGGWSAAPCGRERHGGGTG